MPRPTKFDRKNAIDAVMHEMWRHGYEACSAKALSEKLGITRSSFYHAFESREALFEEVLEAYVAQAPDRMLMQPVDEGRVTALITRLFREICVVRTADPEARGCMAVNCIAELVGTDARLGPWLERAVQAKRERLEALLRQAAESGEIEDDGHLDAKALAVLNLLTGINLMAKVIHSEDALWSAAKAGLSGLGLYRAE